MAGIEKPDFKQAQAFMRVARRDLTALAGMLDKLIFADEIFGFHAQQAVEKCLKAWLCAVGQTYPLTHDLSRLLVLLQGSGADVAALWWADEFTVYAQQARYEDGYMDADAPLDRSSILKRVEDLLLLADAAVANTQTKLY
jgi:HEPN domain-containing protein